MLSQKYKNIDIIVRDDGSKDGTIEILKKYKNKIKLIIGENIGVISSFNELIMYAADYDFYAFCDQDDIWYDDKIQRAINYINCNASKSEIKNTPILYASNYDYYDKDMHFVANTTFNKNNLSFENSLFENIAPGMTMVFNESMKKELLKILEFKCGLHDIWPYRIATAKGKVLYDNSITVRYRRHEATVTITNTKFIEKIIWQFKTFLLSDFWKNNKEELVLFKKVFENELEFEQKKILDLFTSKKTILLQIKKMFLRKPYKSCFFDEIKIRGMIFLWKI